MDLCKNALEEDFEVVINWNHYPEEKVSCENSQEKDKASKAKHHNQYQYNYSRYLFCKSMCSGCHLQIYCM